MSTIGMIALVMVVMAAALIATFWVGFSKENKTENPAYDTKTMAKWRRLLLIYIVTVAAVLTVFFALLKS